MSQEIIELDPNLLESIVVREMLAEGFNFLNKDDIISFWKSKGVDIDNANLFVQR